MIKDIVVNLSLGDRRDPAAEFAVSAAATLDAHVAGVAFVYDPFVPAMEMGVIPSDLIDMQREENERLSANAIGRFDEIARRNGDFRRNPQHRGGLGDRIRDLRAHRAPLRPVDRVAAPAGKSGQRRRCSSKRRCSARAGRCSSCPTSSKPGSSSTGSWCAGTAAGPRRAPPRTRCPCLPRPRRPKSLP